MTTLKLCRNISEVIAQLNIILQTHGDLPVKSSSPGGYYVEDSISIDLNVDKTWVSIEGTED